MSCPILPAQLHMRRALSVFVVAFALSMNGITSGQTVINAPPTAIPFSSSSYQLLNNTILNVYEGAEIHREIQARSGSQLNLLGGELGQTVTAENGSIVNVNDGALLGTSNPIYMANGSNVTIRGGRFGGYLHKRSGATLVIEGVDFAFNGVPIAGLQLPGDEVSVEFPESNFFTGIFASGAPYTYVQ
jgi:hypothetical protein